MSSSMVLDPESEQLRLTLTKQKTAMENAYRRKGERPQNMPPRTQIINGYMISNLSSQMSFMLAGVGHMINSTVIGTPYPPSIAKFHDLKKIMIKDLRLETNHRETYLLLRFVCPASRMTSVMNIAEDEAGTAYLFALYMQDPETVRKAESILKNKQVIVLKEPYFKVGTGGQYLIRVDQPTDIIWLSEDDPRIPRKWRVLSATAAGTAEHWKKKGNDLVGQKSFREAIEMYSMALRSSPTQEEKEILHRNRALAYLRIDAFDSALDDISSLYDPQEKGMYRKALALYGLRRYNEAFEVLEALLETCPDSVGGKQELSRCRLRLAEQERGLYDFNALYKEAKLRPPLLDHASYQGPVEIRVSNGKGRGLFTTKPVKAGELLLCEKAFSYSFAVSAEELAKNSSQSVSHTSILMDVPGNNITVGNHADLICDVSNKLILNPSLKVLVEDLSCRQYEKVTTALVDDAPVIDTFLLAKIIHTNCFGCPTTSMDCVNNPTAYSRLRHTTGLWILASYINHSCESSCTRSFIGDFQIIRAARDMPANAELTFRYIPLHGPAETNQTLSKTWGFECDCVSCSEARETSHNVKIERKKLIKAFNLPNTSSKRKEGIVEQLNKTYKHPTSQVPRYEMWPLLYALMNESSRRGQTRKAINQLLLTFESQGFIIEGSNILTSLNPKIVVKQWGFPHNEATSAWLTLRNLYKQLGKNDLAEQAKEFARVAWILLVGEDTTFVYE